MKVLLTGYEPFGGEKLNPSWEAVKLLNGKTIGRAVVVAEEMPVVWNDIDSAFEAAINKHQPDVVLCVGQAGGRNAIGIERVAVNRANGKDNNGDERKEAVINSDGPDAYLSTLPIVKMNEAVCAAGVPCYISNSAGLYLCNYIFYAARHYYASRNMEIPTGFVHIPYIPEQVAIKDRPAKFSSMDLRLVVTALTEMIKTL